MNLKEFCKGMAAGLIVGSTLAISFMPKKKSGCNCIKSGIGKALKTAGSIIDNIQSAF